MRIIIKNNNINQTTSWTTTNQTEQNLRNFWRHINQYYFEKIEEADLERINYVLNLLSSPIKGKIKIQLNSRKIRKLNLNKNEFLIK